MNPPVIIPAGLKKVPPFPPVAARLLTLLAHPDVKVKEVAELISTDATFTGRLLQCVNSYEFGLSYPVSDIKQAVALVGLDRISKSPYPMPRLPMPRARCGRLNCGAAGSIRLRPQCWPRKSRTLAMPLRTWHLQQVSCTTSVGWPCWWLIHRSMRRSSAAQPSKSLDILDFEREEFGVDHAGSGPVLVELMGTAARSAGDRGRHHDPSEGSELDLLRIVHVACRLAEILGYDIVHPLVSQDVDRRLGLGYFVARARAWPQKTSAGVVRENRAADSGVFDLENGKQVSSRRRCWSWLRRPLKSRATSRNLGFIPAPL